MDVMVKAEMDGMQKKKKTNKRKIIAAVVTVLAVLNLAGLMFFPDILAGLMGKNGEESFEITEEDGKGSGQAVLKLEEDRRTFDGNGIFDPLAGVQALDNDGKDITDKVAVFFASGKTVMEKKIHYTVYDSKNEKLEASCDLFLENYQGPSITIGEVGTLTWEELQKIPETLIANGVLSGDDGFGNDATGGIACFYELNEDMVTADITFSLMNQFQDYRNEKIVVQVEDIPRD